MASTWGVIGCGLVSSPHTVAVVYNLKHLLLASSLSLFQPLDLDSLEFILQNLEFLLSIQEVHYFASVNFEEAHKEWHS